MSLLSALKQENVKYVKYVKSVGQNGAFHPKRFNIFSISPVLSIFGNVFNFVGLPSRNRENVKCFPENAKTGAMLILLSLWGSKNPFRPTDLTYLTY